MLACLCPLKSAAEESLNTLHFASMALRIKSTPVIMMDPQVTHPSWAVLAASIWLEATSSAVLAAF
jgi:hypothetical protein